MSTALNITFPGNLAQVETAAELRQVPSFFVNDGYLYVARALGAIFGFDAGSTAADNAETIIKPNDRSTLQAGRWIKEANGFAGGPPGEGLAEVMAPGGAALVGYDAIQSVADKLNDIVSVTDARFAGGAKGDGATDDQPAIQAAINYLRDEGGGTVIIPAGVYRVSRPIELENFVNLIGQSCGGDVGGTLKGSWLKKTGPTPSDTSGENCIINGFGKRQFIIEGISVLGTSSATGSPTGERGIFLKECYDFTVRNVRADKCRGYGFEFKTCYLFELSRLTAMRCQDYAFSFNTACTTITANNLLAWGTAGGYSWSGVTYSSFTGLACDYSDNPAGSFPGEGGRAAPRAYVYNMVGMQGVTINGAGCEGCLSKWMYAEGAQVTMTGVSVANMVGNEAGWTFMDVRGSGYSHIVIEPMYGFDGIVNTLTSGKAISIENPAMQKVYITGRFRLNNFDQPGAYTNDGIVTRGERVLIDLTQSNMIVGGGTPFLKQDATDVAEVIAEGGVKKLRIDAVAGAAQKFTMPIGTRGGWFLIKASGEYGSDSGSAKLQLITLDTDQNPPAEIVLATWSNTGGTFALNERKFVKAVEGRTLSFVITTNSQTDTMKFTRLHLSYLEGQD